MAKKTGMFVNFDTNDDVEKFFKSGGDNIFLSLKDEEEVNVAFLAFPLGRRELNKAEIKGDTFIGLREHRMLDDKGNFIGSPPCIGDDCRICGEYGEDAKPAYYAPLYVYEQDKMMLFRCSATFYKELSKKAKRSLSRWKKKIWVISREGTGLTTNYYLDSTDASVKKLNYEKIDFEKFFSDRYNNFVSNNVSSDDDDVEEIWSGKRAGKNRKVNKNAKSKTTKTEKKTKRTSNKR